MSRQRPTARDVAQSAQVSVATVSNVFQKPDRVRAETRQRVIDAATALGYVPSANARGLKSGRTGAIGLYAFDYLIESSDEEQPGRRGPARRSDELRLFPLYVDEVQRGVELECRRRGLVLMLGAGGVASHLPTVVDVAGRVDGLIAFARTGPTDPIALVARQIPVVELGSRTRWGGARAVWVDNRSGMRTLVTHLVREHGHRELAYIGNTALAEFTQRYEGFRDALASVGRSAPPPASSNPAYPEITTNTVHDLIRADALPDAFVCSTDQEALTVIDILRGAGLDVPGRVAVTGFDGLVAGRVGQPSLTSVAQPMEDLGRTAVRLLVEAIQDPGETDQPDACLPLTLQLGTSCGCSPAPSGP